MAEPTLTTPEIFNPQNLANTAWAFAKLFHRDNELFTRISQLAEEQIEDFSVQNLSNITWAFAKVRHDNFMFFELTSYHILRLLPEFSTQAAVNSVWAMAEISYHHRQVFCQVAEIATKRSDSYKPQDLSNLIWSFAEILHQHDDLLQSIAKTTCSKIGSLSCQHLACIAWSYAHFFDLKCKEKPGGADVKVNIWGLQSLKSWIPMFLGPGVFCHEGRDPTGGKCWRLKPFSKLRWWRPGVWRWSVCKIFPTSSGQASMIVDEYLLVMESGAGNKIKLWGRDVRVLTGFIIGPKIQLGPMLRWGLDTMRLHETSNDMQAIPDWCFVFQVRESRIEHPMHQRLEHAQVAGNMRCWSPRNCLGSKNIQAHRLR